MNMDGRDPEDAGAEVPDQQTMTRLRSRWPFAFKRLAPDYSGEPRGLGNTDAGGFPLAEDAQVIEDDSQPTTMRGPRGRHDANYPQRVRSIPGLPPAREPGGWGGIDLLPKAARSPELPYQLERYIDQATTVNTGRLIDKSAGFPIRGIQIDNYSRLWLYSPAAGRYIPPFTFGVQFAIFDAPNKIEIHASAPPNFTQPAANTTETFSVTGYECQLEYSPGIPIGATAALPAGANPALPTSTNVLDGFANVQTSGTTTLITIPAGRTWVGTIGGAAATSNAGATAAAATASASITTAGAGVTPAAGSYLRVDAVVGANVAGGTVGDQDSTGVAGQPFQVTAPAGNSVTVQLVAAVSGGANPQVSGWAIGALQ